MFTFSKYDILRLYGEKLLFLPDNRGGEGEKELPLSKPETLPIPEKEVSINVKAPKKEVEKVVEPIVTPVNPPKVENALYQKIIPNDIQHFFESGENVEWRIRPKVPCKVVAIVSKSEFDNNMLMGALLFLLENKGKIDRNSISFGIYQDTQTTWNLTDMPVKTAILFADIEHESANLGDKSIHVLPTLSKIVLDIALQKKCLDLLKNL